VAWWSAAQPSWRDTSEWPFAQEDAGEGDWGDLADGGKDGIFLTVVSLGWWVLTQDAHEDSKVDEAIEDVTWVIKNLVSLLSISATTGAAHPSSSTQSKHTRRITVDPRSKRVKRGRA